MTTKFPVEWMKKVTDVALAIKELDKAGDEMFYVSKVEFGFYGDPVDIRLDLGESDQLEVVIDEYVHGDR